MRESMEIYPRTAAERAMKLQEVLLRATSGKIKWWQAAELIGISERQMRRWRKRYEEQGYQGLLDRRLRKPSSRRVPKEQAEEVLSLYRDKSCPIVTVCFARAKSSTAGSVSLSDWLGVHTHKYIFNPKATPELLSAHPLLVPELLV